MFEQEFSEFREAELLQKIDRQPIVTPYKPQEETVQNLKELEQSLDHQEPFKSDPSHPLFFDPRNCLPLDSESLTESNHILKSLQDETALLLQEEIMKIQIVQKRLHLWEERIEQNKSLISSYQEKLKQNLSDILLNKKSSSYWLDRAAEVMTDLSHAEISDRQENWGWLIKKYGLKTENHSTIDHTNPSASELCKKSTALLAAEYKNAADRYELIKMTKEAENTQLLKELSRLKSSIETLQGFISSAYTSQIEPLQDGVLLLKELSTKLNSLSSNSTYKDLRSWAETFLNEFLQKNYRVAQHIVTEFRKLASIPLPPTNC